MTYGTDIAETWCILMFLDKNMEIKLIMTQKKNWKSSPLKPLIQIKLAHAEVVLFHKCIQNPCTPSTTIDVTKYSNFFLFTGEGSQH